MGTRSTACALVGAAFGIAAACGGKDRVDIDVLGDAAVTNPLGTQDCSSCPSNNMCLLERCARSCGQDRDCSVGERCLRTQGGNGCIHSTPGDCNVCSLGGTICTGNECRTACSFGCAGDQQCFGIACYGTDTQHDTRPTGTGGSAGAEGGAGAGGAGGSGVTNCGQLIDQCARCACNSCPSSWQACAADPGCFAIADCAMRTGCRTNCYMPGVCQATVDSNGGPAGSSYAKLLTLNACSNSPCQGQCNQGSAPPAFAWWRFDEGTGDVVADASGNGHMGTLVNSPFWLQGIRGNAVALDGSSQYVRVSNGPLIGSTLNFTIEAWVNWQGGPGIQTIYSEGGGLSDAIELDLNAGTPEFRTSSNTGSSLAISFRNITPGSWHHLAAVLQGGGAGTLYLDGQMVSSSPNMGQGNQPVSETDIGRLAGTQGPRYFGGTVDEVRIFLIARTSQDIMNDYASMGGP